MKFAYKNSAGRFVIAVNILNRKFINTTNYKKEHLNSFGLTVIFFIKAIVTTLSLHNFQVVIQEGRNQCDSIANILEEMKSDPDGHGHSGQGLEVTTGIPVAVSSMAGDPKKTTIKRVAAPASTVILPNKRSRNIIFAGNTLPQGAIPIQVLEN